MVFATPTQNANQEAEPKMEIAQLDLVFAVLFRKKNMSLITYDGILMSIWFMHSFLGLVLVDLL